MTPDPSQRDRILEHLKAGLPLTGIEALNRFGCFRLAARVAELRHYGHRIVSCTVTRAGKRFAEYRLSN